MVIASPSENDPPVCVFAIVITFAPVPPIAIVLTTAAPVPIEIVVADASVDIPNAPVPEFIVIVPPAEVTANAPDPDCKVVLDVEVVDPNVNPLTAAPVAIETVVADASVDIPNAPVPEFIVKAPPVEVTASAPDPDCNVVELLELVEPKVNPLIAAPVAI